MVHTVSALAILGVPAVAPVLVFVGIDMASFFLVPLVGALIAGTAAVLEFIAPGSQLTWFVVVGVVVNVVALWVHLRHRWRDRSSGTADTTLPTAVHFAGSPTRSAPLQLIGLLVIAVAAAWPLWALRAPLFGYDTQAVWLVHTAFIFEGHHALVAGLTNPAFVTNPDYPPLVPAAGAIGYHVVGLIDQRLAIDITSVLGACGIGLVGTGIVRLSRSRLAWWRTTSVLAIAALFCGASYAFAGLYALNGYADFLWAGMATAAVLYGLVLPPSRRALAVAWLCLAAAALTKNEGLTISIVVSALIVVRYSDFLILRTCARRQPKASLTATRNESRHRRTYQRAKAAVGATVLPLLPAGVWSVATRLHHISDAFFGTSNTSSTVRIAPTVASLSRNLIVLPAALLVLLLGCLVLRSTRERLSAATPLWLWIVVWTSLLIFTATYVVGDLPLGWWLRTSANRTMIFPNVVMLLDMTVWLVILINTDARPATGPPETEAVRAADVVVPAGHRTSGSPAPQPIEP